MRARLLLPEPGPGGSRDPDAEEALLRYLLAIDSPPTSTHARQLIRDGIELPDPESLKPEEVRVKLWEVIHGLARIRTYLYCTDHLSDFDLYRQLWGETLNEPTCELDDSMGDCACHIDLVGDGSDESIRLYLSHYADESDRRWWQAEFPDDPMPKHVNPPYDRDQHLPKRPFTRGGGES